METVLARGERVVRRYPCTAVDRVAMVAGTVIPLPGSVESEGVLTLTDRRVIFELEVRGGARDRQEARLSDVSSVSSMMSKFGRDLRLPVALVVIGFLLMLVPYAAMSEAGAFDDSGDYADGYDVGLEYGYFETFLRAIQSGETSETIPDGYVFEATEGTVSQEFYRGYLDGYEDGVAAARADVASGSAFSVPEASRGTDPAIPCIVLAVIGAAVFMSGSIMYWVSNTTKDWVRIRMGSGGRAIAVKSFGGGWSATGHRALVADDQYWSMTRELGAAILDLRGYREHRVRSVEEDVVVIEQKPSDEPALEPAPDFDDYEEHLVIGGDDDDDGPRIVGPWGDRCAPPSSWRSSPWRPWPSQSSPPTTRPGTLRPWTPIT